jgi:hypothetical protein
VSVQYSTEQRVLEHRHLTYSHLGRSRGGSSLLEKNTLGLNPPPFLDVGTSQRRAREECWSAITDYCPVVAGLRPDSQILLRPKRLRVVPVVQVQLSCNGDFRCLEMVGDKKPRKQGAIICIHSGCISSERRTLSATERQDQAL